MEITGTYKAFLKLVNQPGFAKQSGLNKSIVSLWASGERIPTIDKMEEVLTAAGATVVKEKVWSVGASSELNFTADDMKKIYGGDIVNGVWIKPDANDDSNEYGFSVDVKL